MKKKAKKRSEKVVRDGKVAVLYSPGFGAGWSTWSRENADILLFHPRLVDWVENGKQGDLDALVKELTGDEYVYLGGSDQLAIEWLPEGTHFYIHEYDGSESVEVLGDDCGHWA